MLVNMIKMFKQNDLSLLEVNPLVLTEENNLLCLDGKVSVDSNALYRQKELEQKHDLTQEDEREIDAESFELNYVALDGNVGCMVNGAGLAMATMDLIKLHGGDPANFLDVGGGATVERVTKALEIILSDKNVKSILINIFGGIVRCDIIADGIIEALKKIETDVKFVVRLEGNNAELGLKKLEDEDLDILVAKDLTKATKLAIESAAL
jgi:succinyl-CoA synthetase beta subunit